MFSVSQSWCEQFHVSIFARLSPRRHRTLIDRPAACDATEFNQNLITKAAQPISLRGSCGIFFINFTPLLGRLSHERVAEIIKSVIEKSIAFKDLSIILLWIDLII